MSLWVELPSPLTAESLLTRVTERGVNFLPGRFFSTSQAHLRSFRLSFGGLRPQQITRGLQILGEVAAEMALISSNPNFEPASALV